MAALPLAAQNRYALVIGNSAYRSMPKLTNPVNDATDIAAALARLGYQVDLRQNLDSKGLRQAVDDLAVNLAGDPNSEGFFWYAGHGFRQNGGDYILLVDFEAKRPYPLQELPSTLRETGNRINVVMYDASRSHHGEALQLNGATRGLRGLPVITINDLVILYSTAAGSMADDGAEGKRNSPFTEAVLNNIENRESLLEVIASIMIETRALTGNSQRPVIEGDIVLGYSLNPAFVTHGEIQINR
jgi:uncharacterized caspase-like protein